MSKKHQQRQSRDSNRRYYPKEMQLLYLLLLAAAASPLADASRHFLARRNVPPERNMVRGLRAPAVVDPRSPELLLRCEYDLGGNELYAVNWFRNEDVLFRYSPSLVPKATAYPGVADVNVSLEHSNAEQLLLIGHQDVQRNMKSYEGTYVCEVSTERPFLTDYGVANVSAAILPKANPVLEGLRHNYQVGEFLELACTSAPSLPPAELSFYLNGRKMDKSRTRIDRSGSPSADVASSVRLVLSTKLERQHFQAGTLRVACVAHLPNVAGSSRDYRTEAMATLAARNQRLAQELPPSLAARPNSAAAAGLTIDSWGMFVLAAIWLIAENTEILFASFLIRV
uniref:Ig-like domain-containing protein n=2 Tax=Trichogramma kaykai TaxID=54128 RepID=A0ABD2XME2_9HYME